MIGKKNYVGVHNTTKTIKLSAFDDNDFKIAHPSDFFQSDDDDKFFDQAQR
jgi:hypothetical protein